MDNEKKKRKKLEKKIQEKMEKMKLIEIERGKIWGNLDIKIQEKIHLLENEYWILNNHLGNFKDKIQNLKGGK